MRGNSKSSNSDGRGTANAASGKEELSGAISTGDSEEMATDKLSNEDDEFAHYNLVVVDNQRATLALQRVLPMLSEMQVALRSSEKAIAELKLENHELRLSLLKRKAWGRAKMNQSSIELGQLSDHDEIDR